MNSASTSCIIRPREVHSEAVSGHFPIYLGLGVYGHGTCLHSHPTFQRPTTMVVWGCTQLWTPPPTKKTKNYKATVQHDDQDIWSNFGFGQLFVCVPISQMALLLQAMLRDHSQSIGRQMLLLIRGLKPHIDLLQGPNMKFVFWGIHEINSVSVARTPILPKLSSPTILHPPC